jgi:MYXO-CTERM domain-containing protein
VAVVNPPPAASSKCGSGGIFGFMLLGGLLALRRSRRASTTAL